ncbi:glycosyltransferase [Actinomycetes bacterium KLBMP 9797]
MTGQEKQPRVSVVIPTYNRSDMLRRTLTELTRQSMPADEFEVVVADDGSTDDTKAVVDEFTDRLRVAYTFQEDLGFRAGTARNAGARMASGPLLVFLDTGALPGPEFLHHHLRAHAAGSRPRMCVGYAYGYNPDEPTEGLREALERWTPAETVAHFAGTPAFGDLRDEELRAVDFDLERRTVPWGLTWTINVSVTAEDFWAVGGFDDVFVGWGAEDLELAYRLYRHGLQFHFDRSAWVIETPHERNWDVMDKSFLVNMARFLEKYREPEVEIAWRLVAKIQFDDWEECCTHLAGWTEEVRDRDVAGEISHAVRDAGSDTRIAVLGCGGSIPDHLPPAVLMDFDRSLLDAAVAGGRHTGHHAIGLRIPLPDKSVDTVVITSRLAGLRDRWNEDLLAEAHRVGRRVVAAGSS